MSERLPAEEAGNLMPHVVRQLLSSDHEDRFLGDLLDALPLGVIVLDMGGGVVRYNVHEQRLSRRPASSVVGRHFFREVAPCTAVTDLAPAFEHYAAHGGELSVDLQFQFPFPHLPVPRDVRLRLRGFESGERRLAFLLIEDISEELQSQRLRELLATLVAHDMKNPLTAIRLNVDLVLRELRRGEGGDAGSGQVSEMLGDARMAAERLDRMIRLFLDVYRLERAEINVSWAQLEVAPLVAEVLRSQASMAEFYGVRLAASGSGASVRSDASLVQRILDNMVDNAIRHARSCIEVAVHDGPDAVDIDVSDDGEGVPDEAKGRIFDKFASMSADLRGYNQGLGLTFCTLAARRLGGDIRVLDSPPHGALFRLHLPRLVEPATDAPGEAASKPADAPSPPRGDGPPGG